MRGLLIAGSGGHGKVVADAAKGMGKWDRIAFLDDYIPIESHVLDFPVIGKLVDAEKFMTEYQDIIVAFGDNLKRVSLLRQFMKLGFESPVIIHPSAVISSYVVFEAGTVIFAQAVINPGAKIGLGVIVNTGSTIDHDCIISDGVHISPGANLAGGVKIGTNSWIGVGSSIIQQINIGKDVIIGAGSVIIKDIEDNVTVVGVPGKVIKRQGKNGDA